MVGVARTASVRRNWLEQVAQLEGPDGCTGRVKYREVPEDAAIQQFQRPADRLSWRNRHERTGWDH